MKRVAVFGLAHLGAAAILVGACQDDPQTSPGDDSNADGATSNVDGNSPGDGAASEDGATADGGLGPNTDPTSQYRSGSRLRARVLTNGEFRVLAGMEDSELGDMPCDYQKAQDGRLRCLPQRFSTHDQNFEGLISYLDAECTQPIVVRPASECATVPRYARLPDQVSCADCNTAHEVGERVTPGARVYFRYRGNCSAEDRRDDLEYYAVAPAMPAERFVAIDFPVADNDGQLQSMGARGEDGSFLASYVRDQSSDFDEKQCAFYADTSDVGRCVTGPIESTSFADEQCTTPVINFLSSTPRAGGDKVIAFYPGAICGPRKVAEMVLASVHNSSTYQLSAEGSCDFVGSVGADRRWTADQNPEPAPWPRAALTPVGAGRIQRTRVVTDEGSVAAGLGCERCAPGTIRETLHDTELDIDCKVQRTGADSYACLPHDTSANMGSGYLDNQCTQRVTLVSSIACTRSDYALDTATGTCGDITRVYRLGEEREVSSLFQKDAQGSCRPASAAGRRGRPWLEEVPATTFAQLTAERE